MSVAVTYSPGVAKTFPSFRGRNQWMRARGSVFPFRRRGRINDGVKGVALTALKADDDTGDTSATTRDALKSELLSILGKGELGASRVARLGDRKRLETLVAELEQRNPTPKPFDSPDLLLKEWRLLSTFKPGTVDTRFFSLRSWVDYLFEKGPSPVQSLVVGNGNVGNVWQVLEDPRFGFGAAGAIDVPQNVNTSTSSSSGAAGAIDVPQNVNTSTSSSSTSAPPKWKNVVEFGPGLTLTIEARMEGVRDENSFWYRFSGGYFSVDNEWGGPDGLKIPYPVPFDLLEKLRPGQTKGWFATTYLDRELRISRGNKGSVFVLRRPEGYLDGG